MSKRTDAAVEKFLSGYNCAQAVLYSFSEETGIEADVALRLACGFGAGMARKQEVCGAVTGGIIVIGLKHGRGENQDRSQAEESYKKVRELMSRFEVRHATCNCRKLLDGCDLNTPEGQRNFREKGLLDKTCKGCVETVVETLETLL